MPGPDDADASLGEHRQIATREQRNRCLGIVNESTGILGVTERDDVDAEAIACVGRLGRAGVADATAYGLEPLAVETAHEHRIERAPVAEPLDGVIGCVVGEQEPQAGRPERGDAGQHGQRTGGHAAAPVMPDPTRARIVERGDDVTFLDRPVDPAAQIGERAGDPPDPVIAAPGEATPFHLVANAPLGVTVERCELVEPVFVEIGIQATASRQGRGAGVVHARGDLGRRLARFTVEQVGHVRPTDRDTEVEPVEQGAGHPLRVALTRPLVTRAVTGRPTAAARARIGRADELEASRHRDPELLDAADHHLPVLECLAQPVEHLRRELAHLVEKQDAAVSETDLARPELV